MRKRLLRSRSGFEKPESREEAIMQNILGASNVLEPAESRIEEILQAILYYSAYNKEPESRIEELLLAIKNNGIYNKAAESREEEILLAILRETEYTKEPESRIEELLIEWLQQRSQIKVLEGVPPLTFTSRGLPLINYLIEGNTIQNGTPTPSNPVEVNGVGERTDNFFDESDFGLVEVAAGTYRDGTDVGVLPPGKYTLNAVKSSLAVQIYRTAKNGSTYNYETISELPYTFTADGVSSQIFRTAGNTGSSWAGLGYSDIMLNIGSTAKPYEPYGYKIPILTNQQTTNIYLGSTQTVRQIKKLVFDGTEDWQGSDNAATKYLADIFDYKVESGVTCMSTHYSGANNVVSGDIMPNNSACLYFAESPRILYLKGSGPITLADFKAYLAAQYANGTPVTLWYVLATPKTAAVNEPLMKIGDYADTVSKEQAGVEIPTASGSNTLDVDTTVKPSNIYIEYK